MLFDCFEVYRYNNNNNDDDPIGSFTRSIGGGGECGGDSADSRKWHVAWAYGRRPQQPTIDVEWMVFSLE